MKQLLILIVLLLSVFGVQAQFALAVSPPRFELTAKPGDRLREVIEFSNSEPRAGEYTIKTTDWIFEADASVTLVDDLMTNSCRPWVSIERRNVNVGPNQTYRYRFEINVPPNTPAQECRFAISVQGKEQTIRNGALPIPVSARMAVVVYLAIGDAAPKLDVLGSHIALVNGIATPVLKVRNRGNAHGRLSGVLSGVDAKQREIEFTPASTPIMPGETRDIALGGSKYGAPDTPVSASFPIVISGKLEWGADQKLELKQRFER
jgi:hypothetical protein